VTHISSLCLSLAGLRYNTPPSRPGRRLAGWRRLGRADYKHAGSIQRSLRAPGRHDTACTKTRCRRLQPTSGVRPSSRQKQSTRPAQRPTRRTDGGIFNELHGLEASGRGAGERDHCGAVTNNDHTTLQWFLPHPAAASFQCVLQSPFTLRSRRYNRLDETF